MYPAAAIKTDEIQMREKIKPCTLGSMLLFLKTGIITQYTKTNCVSAIKTRLGQRISRKNAVMSFKKSKNYAQSKSETFTMKQ